MCITLSMKVARAIWGFESNPTSLWDIMIPLWDIMILKMQFTREENLVCNSILYTWSFHKSIIQQHVRSSPYGTCSQVQEPSWIQPWAMLSSDCWRYLTEWQRHVLLGFRLQRMPKAGHPCTGGVQSRLFRLNQSKKWWSWGMASILVAAKGRDASRRPPSAVAPMIGQTQQLFRSRWDLLLFLFLLLPWFSSSLCIRGTKIIPT